MFDFSVEYLLRANSSHPQLVGKLGFAPPGAVTIEVWRCTQAGVESVTLASNQCYAIGDTGRWGWSTEHLDTGGTDDRRGYFYRMSAANGQTFDGQFFVNSRAGMPASRKRARVREL